MKRLVAFVRPGDLEVFSLNKNGTFSLKSQKERWPQHLHNEWTADVLRSHGFAEVWNQDVAQDVIVALYSVKVPEREHNPLCQPMNENIQNKLTLEEYEELKRQILEEEKKRQREESRKAWEERQELS